MLSQGDEMPDAQLRCPLCHRPTVWVDNDNRPFCSERCRLIDLGAWIEERYRVPDDPLPPTEEAGQSDL
jgi:endogenous inhibitor of DNA gyrase (YacG/DUF329 family)